MSCSIRTLIVLAGLALAGGLAPASAETPPAPQAAKLNRLAGEASPYLRQHAANPVDWYPWGPEAFAKAKALDKPILLSVGYSTCHWCHVMARESFENAEIAALLNAHVVAVKVDRERHPEVDQTYMIATEALTQSGGWPNTVLLTPDLKPFFAATYLPPDIFRGAIEKLAVLWRSERRSLEADAEHVAGIVRRVMTARVAKAPLDEGAVIGATIRILAEVDVLNGGIGAAPKFPREPVLLFLLSRAEREGGGPALDAARLTLDAMLRGGIHDQLAGGFHRYAVDDAWRIPHFEKMLYNQALIAQALVGAWRLTGEARYAEGTRRTLDFVLAHMTLPEGGFVSALDAETDGREGLFYTWTPDEIAAALGPDADLAVTALGVTAAGHLEGRSVLHRPGPVGELAAAQGLSAAALETRLGDVSQRLLKVRGTRTPPRRDEKVLAAWNGLMIAAFAEAGFVLREPRYTAAAERAARFVLERMGGSEGRLRRAWLEGHADLDATQADLVSVALGLVALFDATGEAAWLDTAVGLTRSMIERFRDPEAGDYFMTDGVDGFVRAKQREDAETPSPNGAALELLARLGRRHAAPDWRQHADELAGALAGLAIGQPVSNAQALRAGDLLERGDIGPLQFAGRGAVRVIAEQNGGEVRVRLAIAPGWHINADRPLEDHLLPTRLVVDGVAATEVRYPEPVVRKLAVNDTDMALIEGAAEIRAPLPASPAAPAAVKLEIQVCSDRICLDPETLSLTPLRPPPRPSP